MAKSFVTYSVPTDIDARVQRFQARIAAKRGVSVTRVSKAGDTLDALLSVVEAAEQLGAALPATGEAPQP